MAEGWDDWGKRESGASKECSTESRKLAQGCISPTVAHKQTHTHATQAPTSFSHSLQPTIWVALGLATWDMVWVAISWPRKYTCCTMLGSVKLTLRNHLHIVGRGGGQPSKEG